MLTNQGYTAPRAADILAQIRSEYETQTGLVIDWDADVFLGVITAVISERIGDLSELTQALADSRDPDNATGYQLDTIAAVVGVTRIPAAVSRVDLTLTGDPGTVIPEGSETEAVDGELWITTDSVTIGAGGTVDVEARATRTGPIVAAAGEINEIVTPVDGWDSVTNTDAATPGRDRETDAELRLRRQQSLQITGSAAVNAIRSAVLQVEGVAAAVVVDNVLKAPADVGGIVLPGSSLAVVVYPAALTEAQAGEVGRVIYERAPAGIETTGAEIVNITGADGYTKEVRFRYAVEIPVDVVVTVTGVSPASVEDEVESAVTDYFASRSVGEPVRILQILGLLADIDGVDSATVTLNGVASDIVPDLTEIAVLDSVVVL